MARRGSVLDRFTFGGRVPGGLGLVLAVTAVASLFVAFGSRHAAPLFELAALAPERVIHGQVFRLVTWPFIEPGPLALLFGLLFLYWFGRDLADVWGSRHFLAVYLGITLAAGVLTTLIALADRAVLDHTYLGGYALAAAMTVAWGLWFPDRVIRIWFILPIRGYVLAWLTIVVTVVFAVYSGWERFLPELCAEGSMLAWLFRRTIASRWSRMRRSVAEARQDAVRRDRAKKRQKSVAYLRVVEASDDDPPPLPSDVADKIDHLLGGRGDKKDLN